MDLIFFYRDKYYQPGEFVMRRYSGLSHLGEKFFDLFNYVGPIIGVYTMHTLSPAFREKIMLTSAIANDCHN